MIRLSLFVDMIIISLWRHNGASSASSPLLVSSLVEYHCESIGRGRVVRIPFAKFWQRTAFFLLQIKNVKWKKLNQKKSEHK